MSSEQVAIVTGSSRGIGRGIALSLAERGWRIVINYRSNRSAAEETQKAVEAAGGGALLVQADVASQADLTALVDATLAEYGINVYEIRPGIVATDLTSVVKDMYDRMILDEGLTPIKRWGTPDDIGKAVLAIAEGLFPFSTGEVINVDGGFHLHRL